MDEQSGKSKEEEVMGEGMGDYLPLIFFCCLFRKSPTSVSRQLQFHRFNEQRKSPVWNSLPADSDLRR